MKYKGIRVINKPNFLSLIATNTAQAIYPFIFVPQSIYKEIVSNAITPKTESVLEHERTHILRQKDYGILRWFLMYTFSRRFRFEEEIAAIEQSMKIYKHNKLDFDIDTYARYLSSGMYFWCTTKREARKRLEEIW